MFLLQPFGETEQVLQTAARHRDVLVELGQARVAQCVGKFAAQSPESFAARGAITALNKYRFHGADNFFQLSQFRAHRALLAVQLDDDVRAAAGEKPTAGPPLSRR